MTQLELVQYPTAKKTKKVLEALQAGARLTVAKALNELGVYALSQEVGRLERMGWQIARETVETSPGTRVAEYRMPR